MKTQKFLIFFLFLLPIMGLTSCAPSAANGEKTENKNQEKEKIDFENAFIVDVRTPEEFSQGSFEGAVNIPLNTVEDNLEQFKGKEQLVIFCKSGNRSGQAIRILEKNGINGAINGVNQAHLEELKGE